MSSANLSTGLAFIIPQFMQIASEFALVLQHKVLYDIAMDMRDVIISIKGIQKDPNGEKDSVEIVTPGKYGFENGESRFFYEETELTGLDGTRTTFRITPVGVVMRHEGATNSEMLFEQGRKHFFMYDTPYGSTTMGVNTHRISSSMDEHGGSLELDYNIDFNNTLAGRNKFMIQVKENNHV